MKDLAQIQVADSAAWQNEDSVDMRLTYRRCRPGGPVSVRFAGRYHFAQAFVVLKSEDGMHARPPQVGIYNQYLPSRLGDGDGHMTHNRCLSLAWTGTRHDNDLGLPAATRHQKNRSKRQAERFCMNRSIGGSAYGHG